ncbi:MAG: hypothetical protein JXB07_18940 [Anaerolineae bacterium]|nr:hypothetical protein [Anaerolineae bacterium]
MGMSFNPWLFGLCFDAPTDSGSGGSGDVPPAGGDGGAGDADGGGQPGDGGKQPDKSQDEDAKLQEKLNKLIPERAKQYMRSELLGPLGFKSEKELKDALSDLKKRQDAEKSDLDKATERTTELETAVNQRDAEIRSLRIGHDVERAARALKFRDPEDAIIHLKNELDNAEFDESGKVKGLDEMLKRLAKTKSYLIDNGDKPDIDSRTNADKSKQVDEDSIKRRFGI